MKADHEKAMQLVRSGFAAFKKSTEYNRMKADIHTLTIAGKKMSRYNGNKTAYDKRR
jgi:succinylglutamate desuccinylase